MLSITRVLIVLTFSLSALGRGIAHAGAVAPAGPDSGRIVVMISVDGLAAYYLDDPKAEMPTIRALAAAGARATACAGGPIVFGSDSRSRASFSSR